MPSNEHQFLQDSVFELPAFDGQKTPIFSSDAAELRQALVQTLTKMHSEENWEFLRDIQQLNSEKKLSEPERQARLADIEKKYIAPGAESFLNIDTPVLDQIRKNPNKNLANYEVAVKEIFALIKTNIHNSTKPREKERLVELDTQAVEKPFIKPLQAAALDLAGDFNSLIRVTVKMPGFLTHALNKDRDSTLFVACQNICKTAQEDLRELAGQKNITKDELEQKLSEVLHNTQEKLTLAHGQIKEFESKSTKGSVKSDALEDIIVAINVTHNKFNLPEPVSRSGISSTQVSEDSSPEESQSRSSRGPGRR
jgi:hypothetical protein